MIVFLEDKKIKAKKLRKSHEMTMFRRERDVCVSGPKTINKKITQWDKKCYKIWSDIKKNECEFVIKFGFYECFWVFFCSL